MKGQPRMAETPSRPEEELRPLGPPTEPTRRVGGHCQRCKIGVSRPEEALKRCPFCARDVCAECRTLDPGIEAYVCLECARERRAGRGARQRAAMHFVRLGGSAAAIGVGCLLALKAPWVSLIVLGLLLIVFGIFSLALQLGTHHVCSVCEGEGKVRRKKGGPIEYECTVCGHVWVE